MNAKEKDTISDKENSEGPSEETNRSIKQLESLLKGISPVADFLHEHGISYGLILIGIYLILFSTVLHFNESFTIYGLVGGSVLLIIGGYLRSVKIKTDVDIYKINTENKKREITEKQEELKALKSDLKMMQIEINELRKHD